MTGPEAGANLPVRADARWLSKEEAGPAPLPGMVWSEELQDFIALGQQMAMDRAKVEAEPEFQMAQYDKRREALLRFVGTKLEEADYTEGGYPVKGGMHDFYRLPGYDTKTVTKGGASKIANLLRFRIGKKRVTSAEFTVEHGSARVMVELVDADGRAVGAHEAACSTAEASFQSDGVRRKYAASGGEVDYRAAENDVVSRAGKRAFVGALIVAASLEEIFDLERSTDAAGEDGSEKPRGEAPPKPAAAKPAPAATGGTLMAFGKTKGTPLADLSDAELKGAIAWIDKQDNPGRKLQVAREEMTVALDARRKL